MIYHFWQRANGFSQNDIFNKLWFKYFFKTTFFSNETLFKLIDTAQVLYQRVLANWQAITHLSLTRKRGFFVYPEDAKKVVDLIGKDDDDLGLNANVPNAIDNLISIMEERRGKIMFFIKLSDKDYSSVRETLISRGFEEYEDFFNVKELILTNFNKRLVQEM